MFMHADLPRQQTTQMSPDPVREMMSRDNMTEAGLMHEPSARACTQYSSFQTTFINDCSIKGWQRKLNSDLAHDGHRLSWRQEGHDAH